MLLRPYQPQLRIGTCQSAVFKHFDVYRLSFLLKVQAYNGKNLRQGKVKQEVRVS